MTTLFVNIKELIQVENQAKQFVQGKEMATLPIIKNAFLLIENNLIKSFGSMNDLANLTADKVIDCTDKLVLPAWCDSHTHIVYAGNREGEFVDRIKGLTYEEIAKKGGGILNSAKKLQQTSENDLIDAASKRIVEIMKMGTGAVEIKSGYGLTKEAELKMLKVIHKLKNIFPITIKSTF